MYQRLVDGKKWVVDAATRRVVSSVLDKVGTVVQAGMVPPYLPESLKPTVDQCSIVLWDWLEADVMRKLRLHALFGPEHRELRARFWAEEPLPGFGFPSLRARFLYAMYPGDGNMWTSLRDPFAVFLILLRLCPYWGVSVIVFCATFFLIDKSDECAERLPLIRTRPSPPRLLLRHRDRSPPPRPSYLRAVHTCRALPSLSRAWQVPTRQLHPRFQGFPIPLVRVRAPAQVLRLPTLLAPAPAPPLFL